MQADTPRLPTVSRDLGVSHVQKGAHVIFTCKTCGVVWTKAPTCRTIRRPTRWRKCPDCKRT